MVRTVTIIRTYNLDNNYHEELNENGDKNIVLLVLEKPTFLFDNRRRRLTFAGSVVQAYCFGRVFHGYGEHFLVPCILILAVSSQFPVKNRVFYLAWGHFRPSSAVSSVRKRLKHGRGINPY
jgi:hypothetical protein